MPPDQTTPKPITSQRGWAGFTHVLAKQVPYKLTEGGKARKALYALMYPAKR